MNIDVEYTPNPNAKKFVLGKTVISNGSKQFNSAEEAKGDKLAERLFSVNGAISVFYLSDFITVEKGDESINWRVFEDEVKKVISENFTAEKEIGDSNTAPTDTDESLKKINEILDETVRPGLAMDGGGLEIVELTPDYKLSVKYHGACGSCPSSTYSTLQAITFILKDNFHPDIEVVAV
jgi:Fe-S cluster biogenesis protein NfuA